MDIDKDKNKIKKGKYKGMFKPFFDHNF